MMDQRSNDSPDELNEFMVPNDNIFPCIERGKGTEVYDEDGKRYLDLEGGPGANSIGHAHPRLVQAVKQQAERMFITPGRYFTRSSVSLAKRIASLTANRLRRTFFVNSGAEACDGAIKLGLKNAHNQHKAGFGIISLQHGFHGRLSLPLALTGIAKNARGMSPYGTFPGVWRAPTPYCFRCPLGQSYPDCGVACVSLLEEGLDTAVSGEAAIVIAEPVLGVGGIITPPDAYFQRIEEVCGKRNITVIYDEVFTGFGRTGKMFAHQHFDGKPDAITFAKGAGGGVPLAGFIATEELGTAFVPGDHSTTYGQKNQIGMAAGHAVLDILEDENLVENAAAMGDLLMDGLRALQGDYPCIGEVRGRGLMIGVEIVGSDGFAPDAAQAKKLAAACIEAGLLTAATGVRGNILRITPPLSISKDEVEEVLSGFKDALATAAG